MARIHKIAAYIVDVGDRANNRVIDLIAEMPYSSDIFFATSPESETKEFEWDDGVIVNRQDCTREQCEDFYNRIEEDGAEDEEERGTTTSESSWINGAIGSYRCKSCGDMFFGRYVIYEYCPNCVSK